LRFILILVPVVVMVTGVTPTTMNRSPVANSIPQETKDRVFAAAQELDYRPNFMARSLRSKRSYTVGVLVPEISEAYATGVMSGIEDHLLHEGYFYLVASHRGKPDLLAEYLKMLEDRRVEGLILVAIPIETAPLLPTVAVAGHRELDGVTNVVIDHDHAARLALSHLADLGHERIAFFKGRPNSADTEDRWQAIHRVATDLRLDVREDLILQLSGEESVDVFSSEEGYEEGYAFGQKLLERCSDFTALFAFNDVSAIGAMRAFLDAGLRVPEDVSVIGFDDIQSAAFYNPSLTTVRQPLRKMGELAGRKLLERISGKEQKAFLSVEPELVVRASTGPPPMEASSRRHQAASRSRDARLATSD
jgi:DNA-binding LacI/PurR family transcriptional regulator